MKTTLLAILMFSAAAAMAQSTGGSVLSNEPVVFQSPSHPKYAGEEGLKAGTSLLEHSGSTSAKGETPLWEVSLPARRVISLGEAARSARREHESAPKAQKVWTN